MSGRGRRFSALVLATIVVLSCQSDSNADPGRALDRAIQAHNEGRLDDAIRGYFQVLSVDHRNKHAYYNLAQIHRSRNELGVAEGYYRQALEVDPDFAAAQFGLGFTRLAVGAWQEAFAANEHVIRLDPTNAAAHFNLAQALRRLGREAEAQQSFARATQLDRQLLPPASPSGTPRAP